MGARYRGRRHQNHSQRRGIDGTAQGRGWRWWPDHRLIRFFCAAIFLVFVFAGIGIFVLGGLIVIGLVLAGMTFPFLLYMRVPLAIVCVFIAIAGHGS